MRFCGWCGGYVFRASGVCVGCWARPDVPTTWILDLDEGRRVEVCDTAAMAFYPEGGAMTFHIVARERAQPYDRVSLSGRVLTSEECATPISFDSSTSSPAPGGVA